MGRFKEDLATMMESGKRLKGSKIAFPVYGLDGLPIEELNLTVRASNGLKRAGIMTADEILVRDLGKIRNLGTKSVKEIRNAVLDYSYTHMTDRQRENFWKEILS